MKSGHCKNNSYNRYHIVFACFLKIYSVYCIYNRSTKGGIMYCPYCGYNMIHHPLFMIVGQAICPQCNRIVDLTTVTYTRKEVAMDEQKE